MSHQNIHFYFQDTRITLSERGRLKKFIQKLLLRHGRSIVQLNYIFCRDSALRRINNTYLGHDYFTDIISFDLSPSGPKLEAEIYISADRVRDNAKSFKTTLREELHRVIFHGVLHFCGYKDKTAPELEKMKKMEDQCLRSYFSTD